MDSNILHKDHLKLCKEAKRLMLLYQIAKGHERRMGLLERVINILGRIDKSENRLKEVMTAEQIMKRIKILEQA